MAGGVVNKNDWGVRQSNSNTPFGGGAGLQKQSYAG
jgi:hypothetical protein